jgi:outer membrane protein insertion porin family
MNAALRAVWLVVCGIVFAGCASTPEGAIADVDVAFEGTSQPSFRLRRIVEDALIDFARDPESEAPLFDAALDLQDHLLGLGHPDVKVTYRVVRRSSSSRLRVTFDVDEGPRVTVRKLHLNGNEAFDDDRLLELWSRTRSGLLGTGDPYLVVADLELLRSSLVAHYDTRGFLEVAVEGPKIERRPGADEAVVTFAIVEGPRYAVASVDVAPALPLDRRELGVDEFVGQPMNRSRLEALRLRARVMLQNAGRPEPVVQMTLDVDRTAKTVAVRIDGDPGPLTTVGNVTISGNERSADFVVTRHVAMRPGTQFDGSQLESTLRDLYATGLFQQVEIVRTPREGDPTVLDLDVAVREGDAREVDFLAGYGSYETLRGGVFYVDRNLFGLGQRLHVGARASLKGHGLTTTWSEPYLFGSDTSLTVGGNIREREEPAFVDVTRGFDLAFGRNLSSSLRARVGYALQSRDGRDIDEQLRNATDAQFEIGSVFAELVDDRRDSPLYPSDGTRLAWKFEHANEGLGGTVNLDRMTGSAAWFVSLADDWVFGLSARAGAIWSRDDDGIPLQERFFNGGESSVRSFREAQLGPRSANGRPAGGAFFHTFNAEFRFPILQSLHGAVFGDAGNVGVDIDSYGVDDLRYADGGGLRWVLPIGPVRLDAAWNPDRRREIDEESWVLHFSVGLPF